MQPKRMVIDQPEQMAALTSPIRVELLELFGIWGPCAISDIAPRMDRAADSLYYHVKKLVEAGLLSEVERRRTGHRYEAVFQVAALEYEVPREAKTPRMRRITTKIIDTILRLAGRELDTALDDMSIPDEGPQRQLYGRRLKARLTKTKVRELNRHVTEIEKIFADATRNNPRSGTSIAMTIIMAPVPKRESA